jgi:hypothetical protein
MEAVLVLATLVREYRFELLPGQTLELQPAVTLRAAKDLQMRLVSRRPSHVWITRKPPNAKTQGKP